MKHFRVTRNNGSGQFRVEETTDYPSSVAFWLPVSVQYTALEEAQAAKASLEKEDHDTQWVPVSF